MGENRNKLMSELERERKKSQTNLEKYKKYKTQFKNSQTDVENLKNIEIQVLLII